MATKWVNYKELREALDFAQVLESYGLELKAKGDQHMGFCPLPNHKGSKKSPSFSANLKKGIFQCFGCGAKGNVIEFTARMEGLDPEDKGNFRKAALMLQERYLNQGDGTDAPQPVERSDTPEEEGIESQDDPERIVNAPLGFELKHLDPDHRYLKERQLTPDTIAYFGIGYCDRGLMKGRIAIPLHDAEGQLIGYAGRLVDESKSGDDTPKYKFPGAREQDGIPHAFSKSLFLFNGYRIQCPVDHLIVVEGFFDAMLLHQYGYANTVALMGSACSQSQVSLLITSVKPDGCIWLMPDGDEAGRKCANNLLIELSPHRRVRWARLDEGVQPDCCPAEMLKQLLF